VKFFLGTIRQLTLILTIGIVTLTITACGVSNEPAATATPNTSAQLNRTMVIVKLKDEKGESGILAATVADEEGSVKADFKYPFNSRWNDPGLYDVVVSTTDGERATTKEFAVIQSGATSGGSEVTAANSSAASDTESAQSSSKATNQYANANLYVCSTYVNLYAATADTNIHAAANQHTNLYAATDLYTTANLHATADLHRAVGPSVRSRITGTSRR